MTYRVEDEEYKESDDFDRQDEDLDNPLDPEEEKLFLIL
jgi:hypothetical protein